MDSLNQDWKAASHPLSVHSLRALSAPLVSVKFRSKPATSLDSLASELVLIVAPKSNSNHFLRFLARTRLGPKMKKLGRRSAFFAIFTPIFATSVHWQKLLRNGLQIPSGSSILPAQSSCLCLVALPLSAAVLCADSICFFFPSVDAQISSHSRKSAAFLLDGHVPRIHR